MMHKRVEPLDEIHWWYSKEAYLLTYKEKLQPVRGRQFWKIEPSHAMLPHDIVKQVGRSKVKRNREPDEARKRIGQWSQSRKGTHMTCSNCGEPYHNARGCYKPKSSGNVTSCSQTQESDQPSHNERSCYKPKSAGKCSQSSKRKGASCSQTQESYAMESG
ncbi:uncharacterized protein [Nicotiana tomentosiformis]|uniref:uncharacterized protein n=1 Tax=Nicotiana tomentosiformis TaxID=4098 RepID=UPI00051BFA85|nr:uncharacterized protein LOC104105073 [Nicotiana tomentosiformis]